MWRVRQHEWVQLEISGNGVHEDANLHYDKSMEIVRFKPASMSDGQSDYLISVRFEPLNMPVRVTGTSTPTNLGNPFWVRFQEALQLRNFAVHQWQATQEALYQAFELQFQYIVRTLLFADENEEYWTGEIAALQAKMAAAGIQLCHYQTRAACGTGATAAAFQRLLSLYLAALIGKLLHLKKHLRGTARILALLLRLRSSSRSRNLITSQRRWFLYHGSHPTDSCVAVEGCSTGGLSPAFA